MISWRMGKLFETIFFWLKNMMYAIHFFYKEKFNGKRNCQMV
jgi:hypothetical protein